MSLVVFPRQLVVDVNGVPRIAARAYFYEANSSTPIITYQDPDFTIEHAFPVESLVGGLFPAIYINPVVNRTYKQVLKDASDVTLSTDPSLVAPLDVTQANVSFVLYPQSNGEESAGITPVNYQWPYGWAYRVVTNTTPGTTDMNVGLQAAIDSADGGYPRVYLADNNATTKSLLIRPTTQQNINIAGNGRVVTLLSAKGVSIAQAPDNLNAIFVNKNNNGHFGLKDVRFAQTGGFTGVCIYSKEGGGADGLAQCLFSSIFKDLWMDLGSGAANFLTGGMQNSVVDTMTCENAKGVFVFEGVGNADCHFKNFSLFNCYDQFMLQTADTNGSTLYQIDGLNVYSHNRGYLFDVKNWFDCSIKNIILQPATGNLGNVGIGKFTDCTNLRISGLTSKTSTGVPAGETILEFAGAGTTSAIVTEAYLQGNRAVKISATGAVTLEFTDCDFSTAGTSCFDTTGAVTSGTIITRNCKFNDAQIHGFVHTASVGYNWYSYGDEFVNAGLGGNAASRNLSLASSGEIILNNPKIGQNNVSAAASFYINATGSGTVTIINPVFVGTPPSGIKTGAQLVKIIYTPLEGSATYDPPSLADAAGTTTTVTVTGAALGDFAMASFSLDLQGITVTAWVSAANTVSVRFQNESGGVLDLGSGTLRARSIR